MPDLEHYELTESQEDVSRAAVAGPGGAKTNTAVEETQVPVPAGAVTSLGPPSCWSSTSPFLQLQSRARQAGRLPTSFPPPVGTVSTWGRAFCQRDAEILPVLLSPCLVLLFDTSLEHTQPCLRIQRYRWQDKTAR